MISSVQASIQRFATKIKLPVGLFLFSILYIVVSNAALLGCINKFVFGHIGHLLLTAVVLTGFLFIFRSLKAGKYTLTHFPAFKG